MQSLSVADLLERLPSVTLFDTRAQALTERDGLTGARAVSLEALQAGDLPDLPKNEPICVMCEHGAVSELAGLYLEAAGFTEVYNLAGGVAAYRIYMLARAE